MEMLQAIVVLCGVFLLLFGSIKEFKSINWTIKLGVILLLLGEWSFIVNFIKGIFQGIIG